MLIRATNSFHSQDQFTRVLRWRVRGAFGSQGFTIRPFGCSAFPMQGAERPRTVRGSKHFHRKSSCGPCNLRGARAGSASDFMLTNH